ncbi:MAG: glutamine synthetase family protein [Acidimicrobiia bacterium]
MANVRGMLDASELERLIGDDEIDTVLVVFPDYQGRLMGKRVTGHFFRDHVLGDGIEACNYLLAVDVDMTALPGFEFASWDKGYGDFVCRPDLSTLRRLPWLEKTALVMCDLFDEDSGEPIAVSPRQVLRDQLARAAELGYSVKCGSELEFFMFRESYEEAEAKNYANLEYHGPFVEDYHILQTTRDEYVVGAIRRGIDAAGIPVEFSKGEASRGQHEINLRYADALTMADRHAIYKNAAKEIAGQLGRSITFMAKYDMAESGSSCHIHSSLWSADGTDALMYDASGPEHMSPAFRGWLGGLIAHTGELAYLFAPTVNSYKRYQHESWAPTALAWGRDNRTCGFRVVGHEGAAFRVESRVPGADCNPYLAFAATIAAGLAGIEAGTDPGPAFEGNAYEAKDVARVPHSIVDAIAALEASEIARSAFGEQVHSHMLNMAKQEWSAFGSVITDWERRRCFEQF